MLFMEHVFVSDEVVLRACVGPAVNVAAVLQAEPVAQQGQHLHVDAAQQVPGVLGPGIEEELGVRAEHLHRASVGDTG